MPQRFPQLLTQERIRARSYVGVVMLVFATPIVSLALFGKDWTSIAGAVVLGIIAAILAARLVRAFIKVNCPICGSNDIRENYYGGRGSDDVAHTCNACGRQYDCGVLRD